MPESESELWYVVIVDTPGGKRIGIDQVSSGVDPLDAISNPMPYKDAAQYCHTLSEQLDIKMFEA